MYSLQNISYKIRNKYILNELNIKFEPGQVHAIIGPNGAGKSSIIKCLGGIYPISEGEINYFNQNINSLSAQELSTKRGYLSQQLTVAFDLPVTDVVQMGRFPFTSIQDHHSNKIIIEQALELAGIQHLKDRMIQSLSGGELQRVHFARVLAQVWNSTPKQSHKLLLLDEPVNNLDPKYQHEILHIAREVSRSQQTTIVVVLHDLNLAAQYADKILMLDKGKVIAHDIPSAVLTATQLEQLYQIPITVFKHEHHMHISCGLTLNSSLSTPPIEKGVYSPDVSLNDLITK